MVQEASPETFERYAEEEPISKWGYEYQPISGAKLGAANKVEIENGEVGNLDPIRNAQLIPPEEKEALLTHAAQDVPIIQRANLGGGRQALIKTAQLPFMMIIGFAGLLIYYTMKGGYKPVEPEPEGEEHEEAPGMGEPAPAEY
jgi:hypothetical protein